MVRAIRRANKIRLNQGYRGLFRRVKQFAEHWYYTAPFTSNIYEAEFDNIRAQFEVTSEMEFRRVSNPKTILLGPLLENLKPTDTLYDIGACIGTVSCIGGKRLSLGEVVAFEPIPQNAQRVEENLVRNEIDGRVFDVALSNEWAETSIQVPHHIVSPGFGNAALAGQNSESDFWEDKKDEIYIQTVPGDEFISKHELPAPDVITIDVEGAELYVIQGLRKALDRDECRVIFCEVHQYLLDDFGYTVEDLEREMTSLGFEIERFDKRNHVTDGDGIDLFRIRAWKEN